MKLEEVDARHVGMPPYSIVYFLLLDDDVVYVGQTSVGEGRISAHLSDKRFDDVYAIDCDPSDLDGLEDYYIWKYRPKYNQKPNSAKSVSLNRAKKTVEEALAQRVGIPRIKSAIKEIGIEPRIFNGVSYITDEELLSLVDHLLAVYLESDHV